MMMMMMMMIIIIIIIMRGRGGGTDGLYKCEQIKTSKLANSVFVSRLQQKKKLNRGLRDTIRYDTVD